MDGRNRERRRRTGSLTVFEVIAVTASFDRIEGWNRAETERRLL